MSKICIAASIGIFLGAFIGSALGASDLVFEAINSAALFLIAGALWRDRT